MDTVLITITVCPGLDEYSLYYSLNLFPNPTAGELNLNFGQVVEAKLRIHTLVGELVKEARIKTDHYRFSLRDVAEGSYFLTIETDRETVTKRLVVAR